MNLFIPPLGTELELSTPWSFKLYDEYRNEKLIELFGIKFKYGLDEWRRQNLKFSTITFVPGTILTVDRIYIRKGAGAFDSVTFRTKLKKKSVRFWVKLDDVNTMEIVKK